MIDKMSHYIAVFLSGNDGCSENNILIYQVGADVLLSTLITISGVMTIGAFMNDLWGGVLYLLCFMTIRSYSGGYHASTRVRCFFLTCGAYGIVSVIGSVESFYDETHYWILAVLLFLFDLLVFICYVPVENKNKRLPADWKIQNTKKAWISLIIWKGIAAGIYLVCRRLSFQILLTETVITTLILCTRPWREIDMKEKIKKLLLRATILSVYAVGITTVTATSRYTGFQPAEGEELIDAVRKAKSRQV